MRRAPLLLLLLLPPAVAPAQAPATNRVESPAPPPDWENMILSVPGMRGAIPASPQEKAFTTPALTLTESRIAAELQLSEERTLGVPEDVLRRNLSEARLLLASNLVYQASRSFWAAAGPIFCRKGVSSQPPTPQVRPKARVSSVGRVSRLP